MFEQKVYDKVVKGDYREIEMDYREEEDADAEETICKIFL